MEHSPLMCSNGMEKKKRVPRWCHPLQEIIIIKQDNTLLCYQDTIIGGFLCFVLWREGSSGWTSDV